MFFLGLTFLLFPPLALAFLIIRSSKGRGLSFLSFAFLMSSIFFFWYFIYKSSGEGYGLVGANLGVIFSLYPLMVMRFEVKKNDYVSRMLGSMFSVLMGSLAGVGVGLYFNEGKFDACSYLSVGLLISVILYYVAQVMLSPVLTRKPFLFDGLVSDDGMEGERAKNLAARTTLFIPVFIVLPFYVDLFPNYVRVFMCMLGF